VLSPALMRKLAVHVHLPLGNPDPKPDDGFDDDEDDNHGNEDANDVHGDPARTAGAIRAGIEEVIGIEALSSMGDVSERQVQRKDDDKPEDMDPRRRRRTGKHDLEERKRRVEAVLGDFLPAVISDSVPGTVVEDGPVDDGDEERVGDDGGVEEAVESLERAREAVEEGSGRQRVGEGVEGGDDEVEGEAPVGENGEVGEFVADGGAAGVACAGLADDEEAGDEDVEALRLLEIWWKIKIKRKTRRKKTRIGVATVGIFDIS